MPNKEYLRDIVKDLNVCMSLRPPQAEALAVFSEIIEAVDWEKVPWATQDERNTERKPKS
jgi:hypothetical protein